MLSDFAPDTAEFYRRDPDAPFSHLREHDPVHWYEDGKFWCLTRHADIRSVSTKPQVFSSARGLQMFQIPIMQAGGDVAPAGSDDAASILEMDPPEHIRYRKLVTSAFRPRYIAQLESRVREIARATLDACDPTDEVDFIEQIAAPLPMLVIAEMIGIPGTDMARFRRWSDCIIEAGSIGLTDETTAAIAELFEYFTDSLAEHRANPREDIITVLQDAEIDDERLTEGEILIFLMTLLVAGNETTRNLISGGAVALAENPEQRALLADDPALIPAAVEEMLRWVSPVRSFIRCAVTDTSVGGVSIREGDYVVLFYGSGNRDEAVFGPTADRFDVERDSSHHHLAFGFGEHLCLGTHLARLETRVMFEEILARWPRWELSGDIVRLESCLMNAIERMPVRL